MLCLPSLKRGRERETNPTSKSQKKISCPLSCFANTVLFSCPLPPFPTRLEMKMAPLFLSLGPNCSESVAPELQSARARVGGPELSPCVGGPTQTRPHCHIGDNAPSRVGTGGLPGAGDEAPGPVSLQKQAGCKTHRG